MLHRCGPVHVESMSLEHDLTAGPGLLLQITKSQKDTGENHAISALKFEIIKEFLLLGWNVLLSDIDVVVVQVWRRAREAWACPLSSCYDDHLLMQHEILLPDTPASFQQVLTGLQDLSAVD